VNKLIAFVFLGFALCSCSEAQTEGECVGNECDEKFIMGDETSVPGITIGMTQDEVIDVLGANFSVWPDGDWAGHPSSYSYGQTKGGKTTYTVVYFSNGRVRYASDGAKHPDGFFID
jgi:hypothetical protein